MTLSEYTAAVRPKAQGSWNLHLLLPSDLDFFLMLSSISGVGGNASQANYAAGGTYQDALAAHRVAGAGQQAVSLDLGMVRDVGVLAASADGRKTAARLERLGLRPLDEEEVLRLVEAAMHVARDRSVADAQVVTGIASGWIRGGGDESEEEMGSTAPFWRRDPRFSGLERSADARDDDGGARGRDGKDGLVSVLKNGTTPEAVAGLTRSLTAKLAAMFVVPESEIDAATPLSKLGVDSLIAVELRNWVAAAVQAECSVFEIMQAASIAGLAELLVTKSTLRGQ
jgi:hypothetical protein